MTTALLSTSSLALVVAWLLIGSIGAPLPEDPALLATGALLFHGVVAPEVAIPIVFASVLAGDTILFSIARRLGPSALSRPMFRRLIPPHRRERIERAFRRHGGKLVFFARHVAGLRSATFALAGINRMPLRRFLFWDALAACISLPVVVGLGYVFALHLDRVRRGIATAEHWAAFVALGAAIVYLVVSALRRSARH
jgi:membrane protein DedA with SNARE-associated domain